MSDTSEAPKATISRATALAATRAGGDAARAGKTVKDCPYPIDGSTADRFAGNFWIKGFTAAAPGAKS